MNICSVNSPFDVDDTEKLKKSEESINFFKGNGFFNCYNNAKESWSMWNEVHSNMYSAIKEGNLVAFQKCSIIAANICGGGGELFLERLSVNIGTEQLSLFLDTYRENLIGSPLDVTTYRGVYISKTAMRHLYHTAVIGKYVPFIYGNKPITVVEIGGGFGNVCKLLSEYNLCIQYVIIDLPVMLCIQYFYLSFFFEGKDIAVVGIDGGFLQGTADSKIILLNSNMTSLLSEFNDYPKLLLSTVAMTEIERTTQDDYLREIKSDTIYIYGQKNNLSREGGKWVDDGVDNFPLVRDLFCKYHSILFRDYSYYFEFFGKRNQA